VDGAPVFFLRSFPKSTSRNNIEKVFQHAISSQEKNRLAQAYYSHLITILREIFIYALFSKKRLEKRISIIGIEHLHQAMSKGKGVIALTGHFGNWEFAPLFFPSKVPIYKSRHYCIRKSLRFALLDNIFIRRFEDVGFNIINRKNAMRQSLAALKKQGIVYFPFDLRPAYHIKNQVQIDFLGQKTNSYNSMAYIAQRLKCPVISTTFYRINKKQHVIEIYPEMEWQEDADKGQAYLHNTQIYNKRLEEMLLRYPEQWLWSYKRW
jgi:KDO2-lipid IV(A) lauroyltransferase